MPGKWVILLFGPSRRIKYNDPFFKDSPSRLDAAKDLVRSAGGELRAFYLVMGTYDLVFRHV